MPQSEPPRALLIIDDTISPDVAGEVARQGRVREIFEAGKISSSFSGEQAADVLYISLNYQKFLEDSKTLDFILDKVMKVCGKFSVKTPPPELAAKLAKHLRYSGFVKVEVKEDGISAEKDKTEASLL